MVDSPAGGVIFLQTVIECGSVSVVVVVEVVLAVVEEILVALVVVVVVVVGSWR